MTHDPALVLDRHDIVDRLEVIEKFHPDGGDADVVARRFDQHVAHQLAGDAAVVIEAGPAGIGRGPQPQHVEGLDTVIGEHALNAQPLIACPPPADEIGPAGQRLGITRRIGEMPRRAVDKRAPDRRVAR